jgi:ABC-type amino acid transport substrate-binding protein
MSKLSMLRYIIASILVMISIVIIPCLAADQITSAKDLTYITEQRPPYSYEKDGVLQGISVDLLDMAWIRMGVNLNGSVIQLLPWTEGYEKALTENNTVLFSTGRLPEREQLFKWAGPIASDRYVLLAKKDKDISIADQDDLKKYKIAAIENDMAVQLLLDRGVNKENMTLKTTSTPIIEMLNNGSIDAWAYGETSGIWEMQELGENASNYMVAFVLGDSIAYLAFNKGVPDSLVQSFQEAIDYIKSNKDENGISDYDKVLTEYIPAEFIASPDKQNEARTLVNEAVAYVKANGEEKALQEFNNLSGPFVRGDIYIFAYDFNGTCIAHPINPDLVGKTGLWDVNNVDIIGRELALAGRGGGTLYIVFPNPTHEGKEELKQLYIENVNDSLYLGSGLYLSDISASFDKDETNELMAYVNEALQFAQQNGRERSLEVFSDPKGNFTRDGRYIFAYDYDGHVLALPFQPELIGTVRIDAQDPNGVDFIRQIIDVAKMGNGSIYYIYPDASRNMTQALTLSYVASVDDTWFLGSGIYADAED